VKRKPETNLFTCCDDDCCVDEVGEMVKKLVRILQLFEKDQIKPFGVTTSQCYCLLELLKSESLNMCELSDKLNLSISTVTRVIDNLVRDELILRNRDENDRRIVILSLSEKGRKTAEELFKNISQYYKRILMNIPSGELRQVLNSVSLILDSFEKEKPGCC
jgi:MarR family transcriptional regulator, organic hydroperoxide resistance regulator